MNGTRPVLSFSSRIIKAKQDEQMMNQHKKRMSRIKASVDNQRPRSMRSARRVNRKKEQMDRDRQMEIEAANHLLIARILDESHADRKLRRAVYGEPRRTTARARASRRAPSRTALRRPVSLCGMCGPLSAAGGPPRSRCPH